jgi:hypothetical protein
MSAGGTAFIRAEQRRMAVVALAALVWALGVAAIGATEALAYLAPTVLVLALLALGRYPGERAYARHLRGRSRARIVRVPRARRWRGALPALPRGGALVAAGLAGRAPPPRVG